MIVVYTSFFVAVVSTCTSSGTDQCGKVKIHLTETVCLTGKTHSLIQHSAALYVSCKCNLSESKCTTIEQLSVSLNLKFDLEIESLS